VSGTTYMDMTCRKCGREGLPSATLLGGLATCEYCIREVQVAAKPAPGTGTTVLTASSMELMELRARLAAAEDRAAKAEAERDDALSKALGSYMPPKGTVGDLLLAAKDRDAAQARVAQLEEALQRIRIRLDQTDPCSKDAAARGMADADEFARDALALGPEQGEYTWAMAAAEARVAELKEALRLLDLIDVEFRTDPMSVQCFDLRIVQDVRALLARAALERKP
jgi:hypothetical protein